MLWALKDNERIEAQPKIKAICPLCKEEVIPKCGQIKIWHFAHVSNKDCDSWNEPESEWHRQWKNLFPKQYQEVIIEDHIADVRLSNGLIIEFQNSSISSEDIEKRENFYGDMIWVLNGAKFAKNLILRPKGDYYSFRWKHPPKSWWFSEKRIYIDLDPLIAFYQAEKRREIELHGKDIAEKYFIDRLDEEIKIRKDKLFLIKKIHNNVPCGGWGILGSKKEFLESLGVKDE